MRLIGHLDAEAVARKFGDFLFSQGVENQLEPEKDGTWAVWIHSEEEMERAKGLLADYRADPQAAKFQRGSEAARGLREQKAKDHEAYERRVRDRRQLFRPMSAYGFGPLTFVLVCACVVVFVLSRFGANMSAVYGLFISEVDVRGLGGLTSLGRIARRLSLINEILPEIHHGQFWRLLTPMLLHFDILHIFFNMLWLRDLGSMIEGRQGSWLLAVQVLVISAVSNFAQYIVSGPAFGGMSGVVYGLFGYVWIRGKLDPGSGLFVHPSTVVMMIIWFFIGLTGMLGVANTVHGTGLLLGMAWGALSSLRHRR